mmetsp:Transcript_378/g.879  ORF Transcript_378/g.879 Transcript_378/m.879 type:complete len:816 (-) Transcript_378:164-2611(-)
MSARQVAAKPALKVQHEGSAWGFNSKPQPPSNAVEQLGDDPAPEHWEERADDVAMPDAMLNVRTGGAAKRGRRDGDGASPSDKPAKRAKRFLPRAPRVPNTPNLREVLGLGHDLYTARHIELVRKTLDETACCLRWFIMYTLIHSAGCASSPDSKMTALRLEIAKFGEEVPIRGESIALAVNENSPIALLDALYPIKKAMLDVRQLLDHIAAVNRNRHRASYYKSKDVAQHASELRQLVNYFYHRTATVAIDADEVVVDGAGDFVNHRGAILRREATSARLIMKSLRGLLDCLRIKDARKMPDSCPAWLHAATGELLQAAEIHWRGLRGMVEQFDRLHGERSMVPENRSMMKEKERLKTELQELQELVKECPTQCPDPTSEDLLPLQAQFVVRALWTRFGDCGSGNESERLPRSDAKPKVAEAFESPRVQEPERLTQQIKIVVVPRWRLVSLNDTLRPQWEAMGTTPRNFLAEKRLDFKADGCGVTNLDMTLRAIDLTLRVIQRLLIACAQQHDNAEKGNSVVSQLMRHIRECINTKNKFELRESKGAELCMFTEIPSDSSTLSELDYCKQKLLPRLNCAGKCPAKLTDIEAVLLLCPRWRDPVFVCNFLCKLQDPDSGATPKDMLFPEAKDLVEIRNLASHQDQVDQSTRGRTKPAKLIPKFLKLLYSLGERTGMLGEMQLYKEYIALKDELHKTAAHHYTDWQKRQKHAFSDGGDLRRELLERADAALTGLLTQLEDARLAESDSQALGELLADYRAIRSGKSSSGVSGYAGGRQLRSQSRAAGSSGPEVPQSSNDGEQELLDDLINMYQRAM